MYIFNVVKAIFRLLDSDTRRKYVFVQLIFFVSALFQVVGIASIGPFIAILSNPEIIETNAILVSVNESLGFETRSQFIIFTALGSLSLILLSNAVAAMTMWFTYRFSVNLGSSLQKRMFRGFLYKDYLYHKTKNYNRLIATVASQVPRFVYMVFQPFLLLTSQLFIAVIILTGLVILDPLLAFIAGALIGGAYLLTYVLLRKALVHHGEVVSYKNSRIQSILSESFIGIKDVKLGSLEDNYLNDFDRINVRGLRSQAFISLSGELPRFVIESISFGAILLLAIVLLGSQEDIRSVVPILSIYALAGYKLLPTMQQIYKSVSALSGHGSVAFSIGRKLEETESQEMLRRTTAGMPVDRVVLEDIQFQYPESKEMAVDGVTLDLQKGLVYSLAGHSGSGKSTLADVLLGLLEPRSGEIRVNDAPLTSENLAEFRNSLSYVAQSIFILEGTVTENVAFGVPADEVDMDRVVKSLELANAYDFVQSLPEGVDTQLGQDGKLLSGGQRQRIGIARALYRKTDLLVLDEPTSALDMASEYNLLKTLNKLKENMIVLIISHRPASIRMSDQIFLMDKGRIRSQGNFEELLERDDDFRAMMEQAGETA